MLNRALQLDERLQQANLTLINVYYQAVSLR